jgi:hypothetical protein
MWNSWMARAPFTIFTLRLPYIYSLPAASFFTKFRNELLPSAMVKKKSKTSKHKAAASRKLGKKTSSSGGVARSKAFSSKLQQANKSSAIVLDPTNKNVAKKITEASLEEKLSSKTKKVSMSTPARASTSNKGPNNNDEQDEFQRRMASMQERQMAGLQKRKQRRKTP